MKHVLRSSVFVFTCFTCIWTLSPLFALEEETIEYPLDSGKYIGPVDVVLSQDGQFLFVAEEDARQLRKVRIDGTCPAEILPLPIRPARMKLLKDGQRIALVGGEVNGQFLLIDAEKMEILYSIPVGHTPIALDIFSPDVAEQSEEPEMAYVANRFSGDFSVLSLTEQKELNRIHFGREPIAIAVAPNGKTVIIVPHLPEDKAMESGITLTVRLYEPPTEVMTELRLRNGTMGARDVTIIPDGRYAFLTCMLANFENVPTHVDGGWMIENMIAVIDLETKQYADTFYLDDFGRGNGNPWGICCSPDSKFIAVTHAGSCEISLLSLPKLRQILDSRPISNRPGLGSLTTPYLRIGESALPTRMRIPTGLKGTRRIVMNEKHQMFFTAYYEDSIGRIDLIVTEPIEHSQGFLSDPKISEQPTRLDEPLVFAETPFLPLIFEDLTPLDLITGVHFDRKVARLGPVPVLTDIRWGNQLFNDATLCYEHWLSCATCHPDGRSDCVNWDLLNDGIGNPKNTKSMLLSHETPPAMISGVRANAEIAVRSGIKSILFAKRPEREAEAIDAYLKSLQPIPSSHLVRGELSESAKRGKSLFNSSRTGCSNCHPAPFFTDLQMHDVGTRSYRDTQGDYDSPTLVEVWRTSPYLHDGRYITIKELIVKGKHVNTDGRLDQLSEEEIDDLVEYVLSL